MGGDELGLILLRAKRRFRFDDISYTVALKIIDEISSMHWSRMKFEDAFERVLNDVDFPNRRKRLAYRFVARRVLGRRGGLRSARVRMKRTTYGAH